MFHSFLYHVHIRWIINLVEHIKISNIAHCSHHIYHCLNHPQARQKKVSDETIFQSIIHQKTIERLPLFLLHLSTSFWQYLPQMMKNASIDGETLPSKYDINKLELRRDEFRNGTIMKNGASECIGGLFHDRPLHIGSG